jgi:hypothetical protein
MTPSIYQADTAFAHNSVLFNCWKHHAGFIQERIGDAARHLMTLNQLSDQLVVVGSELMDLYYGPHTPAQIAKELTEKLQTQGNYGPEAFEAWVRANKGYRLEPISDGSIWTLRSALDDDRYIHIHPGRHAPNTLRVRANVLKTAVLVLAETAQRGGSPLDLHRINRVRARYLRLENVYDLSASQSIKNMIELLKPQKRANFPGAAAS